MKPDEMIANRIKTYHSTIFITMLTTLFWSCGNSTEQNNNSSRNTGIAETKVDSTNWLRPSSGIRSILEDSQGNLWFSSTEYICMFDGEKITYFNQEDGLDGVGRIHEDENGTIWVANGFNAYRYDGESFIDHPLNPDTTDNQWDIRFTDLWFQKGIERFGNTPGPPGIYRCRNGDISFLTFPVPPTENDDSRYHPTTGAIKGKDGTTWFGTMEIVIGYKDGVFNLIDQKKMGRSKDPRQVGIRGLFVDSKGNLWMADNGSGYFVYDGDTVINFTRLHHLDKGDREGNTLHRAFSIAEDDSGNMWFGTVYSGIWRYDGKSFTNYAEKDGVVSDNIWTIYKTKEGDLLFAGENPGAVYKFNGNSLDRIF